MEVNAHSLFSKWFSESGKLVAKLFAKLTEMVEDTDCLVFVLIDEVLHELGYQALEAADGPSGLAVLQSDKHIDLLVTDIGLPGLNGRQVADAARLQRPDLRVLFMTGYAETAAAAQGFLEPGMELLTKPFTMDVLAARLRSRVEGGRPPP